MQIFCSGKVNLLNLLSSVLIKIYSARDPISCYKEGDPITHIMTLICWLDGLYIDESLLKSPIGREVVSPGVGRNESRDPKSKFIYQKYYQWIIPLLLFQSCLLYLPRVFWHLQENDVMKKLLEKTGKLTFNIN